MTRYYFIHFPFDRKAHTFCYNKKILLLINELTNNQRKVIQGGKEYEEEELLLQWIFSSQWRLFIIRFETFNLLLKNLSSFKKIEKQQKLFLYTFQILILSFCYVLLAFQLFSNCLLINKFCSIFLHCHRFSWYSSKIKPEPLLWMGSEIGSCKIFPWRDFHHHQQKGKQIKAQSYIQLHFL